MSSISPFTHSAWLSGKPKKASFFVTDASVLSVSHRLNIEIGVELKDSHIRKPFFVHGILQSLLPAANQRTHAQSVGPGEFSSENPRRMYQPVKYDKKTCMGLTAPDPVSAAGKKWIRGPSKAGTSKRPTCRKHFIVPFYCGKNEFE